MKAKKTASPELKYILTHLPGHLFWLDTDHRLVACNQQQAKTLGFSSPEEIIGKSSVDLFPQREAKMIDQHNQEVMDSREEKSYEEEVTVLGKKKVFFVQKIPLIDDKNEVIGVLGIGADITKNKREEEKHLDSLINMAQEVMGVEVDKNESPEKYAIMMRDFYENIIAETPGNVYWMNRECVLLGCNKNMAKLAGLSSRYDIYGKTDFELPWKAQASVLVKNSQEVMKTGKVKATEETAMNIDGSTSTAITNKVPLKDKSGKVIGVLGISIDITARKKLEEELKATLEKLRKANEGKLSLLSIADIKLRNLLNSSFNALALLKSEHLTPRQADHLDIAEESNQAMLPLMDYLLDYVNLETNALQLCKMPYDLKAFCQEVIKQKSAKAFKQGIDDIILDYQGSAPIVIDCDGRRLEKVMNTLLDNAIRFSIHGVIILLVEEVIREEGHSMVEISVIDQGRGMSQLEQANLFNLLAQLPIKREEDYVKAGVKLSIAKQIVTMMEGEIGVQSVKGKGSTFWIRLTTPIMRQPLNRSNSLPWWDQYRKSVRVLLIDDCEERRTLLHQTLASSKNAVANGKEAIKKITQAAESKAPFHLIVLDGHLKTIDSQKLLGEINQAHQCGHLPTKSLLVALLHPGEEATFFSTLTQEKLAPGLQMTHLCKPTIPVEFAESLKMLWGQLRVKTPYVLLVEDELLCQRAETAMLVQLGCRVDAAISGEAAIKLIEKREYDAVFVDIGLPGKSGLEVMQAIQKMRGKAAPPMIVITAHNTDDDSDAFGGAGAFDVLFKPVSLDTLKRALHEAVIVYEDEMNEEF